jgi:hypothetical protein
MARKSGWQEFAENFQGVYGTFKQIGQDVETSRIMDDEKFMAGAGKGLSGGALDKARYKALGDIYTKYGNAKEGLAMRQSISTLEASERKNELDAATLQEQIKQNGLLKSALMRAQAYQNNASGNASNANAADTLAMTPVNVANTEARTDNTKANTADTLAMTPVNVANTEARTDNTKANTADTLAMTPVNVANTEAATAGTKANTADTLAMTPLNVANTEAATAGTKANTAQTVLENSALQAVQDIRVAESQFLTDISNPKWWEERGVEDPTPAERESALVGMYENSPSIPIERKMAVQTALKKHGIENLQNTALETAEKAKAAVSGGGVEGLIKWYDGVDDGEATSLALEENDGVFQLVQKTGGGLSTSPTVLYEGGSKAEIEAQLMGQITDPGSGMEIAASILEMRSKAATTKNTEARTEYTLESLKGMVGDRQLTGAQIQLANVRAREIRAKLRATYTAAGKAETKVKEDQAALDEYLTKLGPTLALAGDMDVDVDALVQQFIELRQTPITFEEE